MPHIDLRGPEGNAFALMANVQRWCRQLDRDPQPILDDMMAGDYEHLLDVIDREFHGVVTWVGDPRIDDEEDN